MALKESSMRKNSSKSNSVKVKPLFFAYILKCADDTLYAGASNNLEKRIHEHNTSKRGAHYTKIRRPVQLIFQEGFQTLSGARKREAEYKRMTRRQKFIMINKASKDGQ